jgi:RimJ/RimL family protein N-acetyltransferase
VRLTIMRSMSKSDPVLATRRLSLSPLASSDLESVFQVNGDPDTWQHLPAGRHKTHEQSRRVINAAIVSVREHRIGQWAVRVGCEDEALALGTFIGTGGVNMTPVHAWNLGYRLSPMSWGRGFASEIALAAVAAVRALDESVPITARVLSNNPASARVAVRVGLQKVWEGPTAAAVEPGVYREVFSDRELNGDALQWLVDNG